MHKVEIRLHRGALRRDEQRATLENVIQQFGDVLTADEALALLNVGG
jgi:hypothetical protein